MWSAEIRLVFLGPQQRENQWVQLHLQAIPVTKLQGTKVLIEGHEYEAYQYQNK